MAMVAAELQSQLLTAGHDVDLVRPPLVLDRSTAGDRFVGIDGQERVLRPGDMLMRDAAGILSAVVYGPDQRTRIGEGTRRALFSVYAPAGIATAAVRDHLDELAGWVSLIAPAATVRLLAIYPDPGR